MKPVFEPVEGHVCGMFNGFVEQVWKDGDNCESSKCRSPGAHGGFGGALEESRGLPNESVNGKCRKGPER